MPGCPLGVPVAATRFRGIVAAAFTATLAVAAHGLAGAALTGGSTVLLLTIAAGVGVVVGTWGRAADRTALIAALAGGQLLAHCALAAGVHCGAPQLPALVMAAAHLAAVLLGALLVAWSEHLFGKFSSVVERLKPLCCPVPPRNPVQEAHPPHDVPPSVRLLATSISHRGPPAGTHHRLPGTPTLFTGDTDCPVPVESSHIMLLHDRVPHRALAIMAAAAVLTFGSVAGAGPASAHVQADTDIPVRGQYAVVTFRVPNESDTGSPTTKLTVNLPVLTSVYTQSMVGWSSSLERDTSAGTARSITWSAKAGGGIQPDQFEVFTVSVKLPDADTVMFPTTQVYADGTTVQWDDPPVVNGGEPEHPAPMLELLPADQGPQGDYSHRKHAGLLASLASAPDRQRELTADSVARALGGGALLLSALGVGISVVRRRG